MGMACQLPGIRLALPLIWVTFVYMDIFCPKDFVEFLGGAESLVTKITLPKNLQ